MRVVQINTVCGNGSTGRICVGISKMLNAGKIENYILYSSGTTDYAQAIKCTEIFPKLQALRSRIFGNYGFNSSRATCRIIEELERIQPDVVHLHNLHGHNCNIELLMSYLKNKKIKILWTFHDCWTFTAYCPHFEMAKCNKWKIGCEKCVQSKAFSWIVDRSAWLYNKKRSSFTDLDLTIITPSQWLADRVQESFFRDYPVKVIHNGIDIDVFKPSASEFRKKYHIPEEKFIVLGVAIEWVPRKGADVLIRMAKRLDPDKFQVVLVGADDRITKELSQGIISIYRTENQTELAKIYSAADLFVNPTREEVFGLVNVEANACGLPVLTFRTGGSPECIDEKTGLVVDCDDEEALYQAILKIAEERPFSKEDCIARAKQFSEKEKYAQYYSLYTESFQK